MFEYKAVQPISNRSGFSIVPQRINNQAAAFQIVPYERTSNHSTSFQRQQKKHFAIDETM